VKSKPDKEAHANLRMESGVDIGKCATNGNQRMVSLGRRYDYKKIGKICNHEKNHNQLDLLRSSSKLIRLCG